jgi:hypothetical protein
MAKTYIQNGISQVLLSAEDKEGAKVAGLDNGNVVGIVLDNVVGPRAGRAGLPGELHPEGAVETVAWGGGSGGAQNVDGGVSCLAGVVHLDSSIVL